jgi:hypothetical protein
MVQPYRRVDGSIRKVPASGASVAGSRTSEEESLDKVTVWWKTAVVGKFGGKYKGNRRRRVIRGRDSTLVFSLGV